MRRDKEPAEADECVGADGGDGSGGDEACECHGGWKDGAKQESGDAEDDGDGVEGLFVSGDGADPGVEGKDTVTSHSPNEPGGCYRGDGGVEQETEDADNVHDDVASAAECHGVEEDEGLRCAERVECIEIRRAEEEENDDGEA